MVFESLHSATIVVAEGRFKAFRDSNGIWTYDVPIILIEDLVEEFREVTDADRATKFVNEAKLALST